MGRLPNIAGHYLTPIGTDGAPLITDGSGKFTLAASTTYYLIGGGDEAPFQSFQITGYTAGLVITSATIQDANHSPEDVTNHGSTIGEWITEDPLSAIVSFDGAGWSALNGVVSASGAGLGGAMWHLAEMAAFRTRIELIIGATGGQIRASYWGKE